MFRLCILASAALILGSAAAFADDVDFSGKRIQLLVPVAAGASADLSARFIAPLLSEHLPGKPTIVIRNVAGAGSIAGGNEFQNRATPDGTDLILLTPSAMLNYVFHDARVKYKLDEWVPVAGMSQGMIVYSNAALGIKDGAGLTSLGDKQLVMAANSATGIDLGVLLPLDLLGVAVKPVFGMNRGEVYPGFQRGEFNISFDAYAAYRQQVVPMVEAGTAVPLFSLGYSDASGTVVRDPSVPELPHFLELYEKTKGHPLDGPAREAWNAVYNLNVMSTRAILLPGNTPKDVVDTYTKAVEQLVADIEKDPALKAKAADFIGPQPMTTGEAAARNMKEAVQFSPEGYAWLKDWLKRRYDVTVQ